MFQNKYVILIGKIRSMRHQITQRAAVKSAVINSGWMLFDRIIRLIGGLFIGVWVARYLGPEHFGLFSTLISIQGIAVTLCGVGFDGIITRYFIRYPHHSSVLLGTTVTIRAILGIVIGAVMLILIYFRPLPGVNFYIWVLMSVTMFFSAFNALRQYYDSRGESKYVILPELVAFGLSSGLRILGILYHFRLEWFVGIVLLEGMLGLIGYHWIYWRRHVNRVWTFRASIARLLFRHSWPILLTSGSAIIFFKIDQMILLSLVGSRETGIYSAAVRISEIAYFFPTILTTAVYPGLTKLRKIDRVRYESSLRRVFSIGMAVSYCIIIVVTLLSSWIISTLYGSDYIGSGPILIVHIWSLICICNLNISSIYITNEGLTRHYILKDAVSALCNIGLNLALIPYWNGLGSAIATLVSYSITAFFANAFIPQLRPLFKIQMDSLTLKGLWNTRNRRTSS
ncbi:flippase [bacterium]|nr:flippase [bacterium]